MLDTMEVRQETDNGLTIGTMTFDLCCANLMTLNSPSSRSLKLHVKYFNNGVENSILWADTRSIERISCFYKNTNKI